MKINKKTRLFFDSSVLIAGILSPKGGSGLIIKACLVGGFMLLASQAVFIEVERNLTENFSKKTTGHFNYLIAAIAWTIVPIPSEKLIYHYSKIINEKDAHVLAAAIAGESDFLLTLDRKHFMAPSLKMANLSCIILTPGDFIKRYYPLHENFPKIPPPDSDSYC
jgi:putative PIN family toxin of toxin-antitoxin system